jgi:putative FmdB family regulatory protein
MPIYEFRCSCGNETEAIVPSNTRGKKCDVCGGTMFKVISTCNFCLKGNGWARDNYGLSKKQKGKGDNKNA